MKTLAFLILLAGTAVASTISQPRLPWPALPLGVTGCQDISGNWHARSDDGSCSVDNPVVWPR